MARRFEPAGRGIWRESEGWPAFRVLGEAARTAQIVRPDPNATVARRPGGDAVPVDVPEFKKRVRARTNETTTYTEELRVPLLLRAADPGAKGAPGRLEGAVTWEFVW